MEFLQMVKYAKKGNEVSIFPMGKFPSDWEEITEEQYNALESNLKEKENECFKELKINELKNRVLIAVLEDNQEELISLRNEYKSLNQ